MPVITILGLTLPGIIGGSVIMETIFGIPGMGQLMFQCGSVAGLQSGHGHSGAGSVPDHARQFPGRYRICFYRPEGETCDKRQTPQCASRMNRSTQWQNRNPSHHRRFIICSRIALPCWAEFWFCSSSFLSILAPLVAPYNPSTIDIKNILVGPSFSHPLGTDDLGRDVLSRMLWGGRISLEVGIRSGRHCHHHRPDPRVACGLLRGLDRQRHHAERGHHAEHPHDFPRPRRDRRARTEHHQHHDRDRPDELDGTGAADPCRIHFDQRAGIRDWLHAPSAPRTTAS